METVTLTPSRLATSVEGSEWFTKPRPLMTADSSSCGEDNTRTILNVNSNILYSWVFHMGIPRSIARAAVVIRCM